MAATAAWSEIDQFVTELEQAHAAGGRVEVAPFLPSPHHPQYDDILTELLRVDLEMCWGRDVRRTAADQLERFPRLRAFPDRVHLLAFEEYRARRRHGEDPDPESFRRVYRVDTSGWPTGPGSGSTALCAMPGEDDTGGAVVAASLSSLAPATGRRLADALDILADEPTAFLDYELVRKLGAGAFGRVYLARQPELADRFVVLKIAADLGGEPATLARLQHTNIVPVYAVHRRGPVHAFCMPYHGTTTLKDLLREMRQHPGVPESGRWIPDYLTGRRVEGAVGAGPAGLLEDLRRGTHTDAILRLFARLADGLAYAHGRGVLHQDLKPANVLIADDGEPMLLDFNLASHPTLRRTTPGAYVGGTLPYMSPQRLAALRDGHPHESAADDVYALGLMLAEMLTGRPTTLMSGRTASAVVRELIEQRAAPFADVRSVNPRIPPSVAAIVAKCVAVDPGRRYPTARELAEDLRCHFANRPLRHAGNPSLRERFRKWCRRHPRLTSAYSLGAVTVAVVAALSIALVSRNRQLEDARRARERIEFAAEFETARLLLADPTADPRQTRRGVETARRAIARVDPTDADLTPRVRELHLLAGRGHRALGLQASDPNERAAEFAEAERLVSAADRVAEPPAANPARHLRTLAAADMDRRENRSAADRLSLATRHDPSDPMGWFQLGVCRERLQQPVEAAAAYTVVIALRPDSAAAYYRRGAANSEAKRWATAVSDFDDALRLDPNFLAAFLDRALAKVAAGDLRGADDDFTRVLEFSDAPTRVFFLRAGVRNRLGRKEAAADDRREGLAREPADELSWISRGVARIATDPKAAVADFDSALKVNPDSAKALENKAHVLAEKLGRVDDAIGALDIAVSTNPDYVLARAGRGVLLARLGKREAAVADATAALRLSPVPVVQYQAACVYALTSKAMPADRPEAVRLLGLAIENGFGAELLAGDPDLAPLRGTSFFGVWPSLRAGNVGRFGELRFPAGRRRRSPHCN